MCQPGLGACGASLSSPGRRVLSDLTGAGNRQMVNIRLDCMAQSFQQVWPDANLHMREVVCVPEEVFDSSYTPKP